MPDPAELAPGPDVDEGAASTERPIAPSAAVWATLTSAQRRAVVERCGAIPDAELSPAEGTQHFAGKVDVLQTLGPYFARKGKKFLIAAELGVYYPAEPRFAPDLLVVFEVEPHARMSYVVSHEGKGLDWVMEVHLGGNRKKDAELNVKRYARLGIPEYFVWDRRTGTLRGYQLATRRARIYTPILPQLGRYRSDILDLELKLENGDLRFYASTALLESSPALAARLEVLCAQQAIRVDEVAAEAADALRLAALAEQRAADSAQQAEQATQQAEQATQQAAEQSRQRELLQAQLAAALAEIAAIKRGSAT